MLIFSGMEIIAALIGFVCASVAALVYAFYQAPEAYEGDEGLEIIRRRGHGRTIVHAGEIDSVASATSSS